MGKSPKKRIKNPHAVIYTDLSGKTFNLGTVSGSAAADERVRQFEAKQKKKRGSIF